MIYGKSYEGSATECRCGHVTNAVANCAHCGVKCCECCEDFAAEKHFCSPACLRAECEHIHVRVEDDYDVNDEFVTYYETITCRDCGQELRENRAGELEVKPSRRAA
jgi:hypothetical protein